MQQKLTLEVGQERFTRLDRTLLDEARDGQVDLRISPHQSYLVRANRHLLISRLDTLETMGLAQAGGARRLATVPQVTTDPYPDWASAPIRSI